MMCCGVGRAKVIVLEAEKIHLFLLGGWMG
jgi:hypothetical protein